MKITYLGHSALYFSGETDIMVDPFVTGNPWVSGVHHEFSPDYIFVSHGHGDHIGDAVDYAKRSGALIIAPYELAVWCGWQDVRTHPMHIGGRFSFDFGWVKLVNAIHGSGLITKHEIHYMGNPCGFLWETEGKRFYFAGDTALTLDMKLLRDYGVDYAFLPIGDNFTMGVDDAIKAAELIRPKHVIPIHYNTFKEIEASPEDFIKKARDRGMEGIYVKPGETLEI